MKELSKQETALAIAVKDGWDLFEEDAQCPDHSLYRAENIWLKGRYAETLRMDLVENYTSYNGLMLVRNEINAKTPIQINMYGGCICVVDDDTSQLLKDFLFTKEKELDALIDAIYYALYEVNNGKN